MDFFLFAVLSYLLGSLNGAQLTHHFFRIEYPRHITRIGTKNAGAQNIWISVGKISGTVVFLIDSLKGVAVIVLARMLGFDGATLIIFGACAIAGHNWPLFFHFRGGRGFATLAGIFFAFNLWVAIIASLVSIPFVIFRYSGITPFVFLLVGSLALYSTFGIKIIGAYLLIAIVLYTKRIYAEWDELKNAQDKLPILRNLLIYDRATSKPPALHELW